MPLWSELPRSFGLFERLNFIAFLESTEPIQGHPALGALPCFRDVFFDVP